MKKLAVLMFAVVLACGTAGRAAGAPVFVSGVTEASGWLDVEQGFNDYCWAATSANMLAFSGWNGGFADNSAIFNYFTSHWSDDFGNPYYATNWFFDGSNEGPTDPGDTVPTTPGGNFYNEALWWAHFGYAEYDYPPGNSFYDRVWDYVTDNVTDGRSFTMLVGPGDAGQHWVTGWGYEDTDKVWITDSWDGSSDIFPMTLTWNGSRFVSNYGGNDWNVLAMGSMAPNSDNIPPNQQGGGPDGNGPEPATLLLLAAGMLGLGCRMRARR